VTRVAVAGANGRMGRALVAELSGHSNLSLSGVWERHGALGTGAKYIDEPSLVLHSGPQGLQGTVDVAIDFTTRAATLAHAAWCAEHGVALVVGTTGLSDADLEALDQAALKVAVVQAPNMSVGVNAMLALVADAARMLGSDYDLEIVETHHRHKRDAPSGTALGLLAALQSARAETQPVFERYGDVGPRTDEEIGVQTLRGGDVVGEHTVFFLGSGEQIEITHRATDRGIFAAGAVRAAAWAAKQAPGRYTMQDVLKR
jgi:4-hydroxy-tetrahydrodipicolinate reductase